MQGRKMPRVDGELGRTLQPHDLLQRTHTLSSLDCDGLDPKPSGCWWMVAGIYLHVGNFGMQLHHV